MPSKKVRCKLRCKFESRPSPKEQDLFQNNRSDAEGPAELWQFLSSVEADVFEVERLIVDAANGRCDPVGEFAGFGDPAAHE
jgi:hypothetical protein